MLYLTHVLEGFSLTELHPSSVICHDCTRVIQVQACLDYFPENYTENVF